MKLCTTCGNEIGDDVWRCPFCEERQDAAPPPSRAQARGRIETLNLKEDRPTVEEALLRLDRELDAARAQGIALVRVIHGYGSSGIGGDIKAAVRRRLAARRHARRLRGFMAGEDYSDRTPAGRHLLAAHPGLRAALRTDRANPGITLVEP